MIILLQIPSYLKKHPGIHPATGLVWLCLLLLPIAGFARTDHSAASLEFRNALSRKFTLLPNSNPGLLLNHRDTVPETIDVTVVIPFEYKQSSLNYASTFRLMDSVAEILLDNDSMTFSIDGYSYLDEGNDYICYWLSYNRALAVKTYVLGRGVDSARLIRFKGKSKERSIERKVKKIPINFNCVAEIELNYPVPKPENILQDTDEDGINDENDSCKTEYGYRSLNGCPDKNAIIIPFEPGQSSLYAATYKVLDSIVAVLRKEPSITLAIEGHAFRQEGVTSVCDQLARERADIVRRYLLTRRINASRITQVKSFSNRKPINAGRNPWEIARNSRAEVFLFLK